VILEKSSKKRAVKLPARGLPPWRSQGGRGISVILCCEKKEEEKEKRGEGKKTGGRKEKKRVSPALSSDLRERQVQLVQGNGAVQPEKTETSEKWQGKEESVYNADKGIKITDLPKEGEGLQ